MFYFPKTQKEFKSKQGANNHARNNYETIEHAYLDINFLDESPICPFCNQKRKFRSLNVGYYETCTNKECIYKNKLKNNRIISNKRKEGNREFGEYVLKNIIFYRDVYLNDKKYFDEFFNKKVEENVRRFISNNIPNNYTIIENRCIITGKKEKIDVLREENDCFFFLSKSNYTKPFRNISINELLNFERINKKLYYKNDYFEIKKLCENYINTNFEKYLNVKKDTLNIIKKYYIHFSEKYNTYFFALNKTNNTLLDYFGSFEEYKKYHNDNDLGVLNKCKECNNIILVKDVFNFTFETKQFCSYTCYWKNSKGKVFSEEFKRNQSILMKEKIKNGEFTPKTTNSFCYSRVDSIYENFHFRSTWEAVFFSIMKERGLKLNFESIRIPYLDYKNEERNYIVDFVDEENKVIYEIKPDSEIENSNNKLKFLYAKEWCRKNNYKFIIINDKWFKDNLHKELLTTILKNVNINYEVLEKRMKQFL